MHDVGRKGPNRWGLYDMHGNAYEWCQDWYGILPGGNVSDPQGPSSGSTRVVRGGYYWDLLENCGSAIRSSNELGGSGVTPGFRVVLAPGQ